jgi:hypothetical protein
MIRPSLDSCLTDNCNSFRVSESRLSMSGGASVPSRAVATTTFYSLSEFSAPNSLWRILTTLLFVRESCLREEEEEICLHGASSSINGFLPEIAF